MFFRGRVLAAFAAGAMFAAETPVSLKDLPEAVQKTIQEQTRNSRLRRVVQEVEDGKTFYEAETTMNGRSRDVLIDGTGAVVEVEEAIAFEQIPEAARRALKAAAGSGKVLSVEAVTKGSAIRYEAVIRKNGRKSEVAVNADGTARKD